VTWRRFAHLVAGVVLFLVTAAPRYIGG